MNHLNEQKFECNSRICFKDLVNSISQFVFVLNSEGYFLFVNDYCQTVLGYSNEELSGKSIFDLIKQGDKTKFQDIFRFSSSKNLGLLQHHFLKKDGSEVILEWSAKWNEANEIWYCNTTSIHANHYLPIQKEFEKKMKEQSKRLSSLLERIGEGFVALDEEGRVIYWNKQAEMISGKSREEVLSQKIWDCYPQMTNSELCSFYNKAIDEQIHQQYEAYYPNEGKWIEIVIHPGNNGITAFFRDITEQKKIEEELSRTAYRRSHFYQNWSHN